MSTGGGTGYTPEQVHSHDRSLLDKIKDAVKPSKHSKSSSSSTGAAAASESRPVEQGHGLGGGSAGGEAYTSSSRENVQGRPQEGLAGAAPTHDQNTMPAGTGLRHQGQDTSGGVTDALKSGSGAGAHSTTGQAVREMTDSAGSSAPTTSKKLSGGLGSDPGSAAFGR